MEKENYYESESEKNRKTAALDLQVKRLEELQAIIENVDYQLIDDEYSEVAVAISNLLTAIEKELAELVEMK